MRPRHSTSSLIPLALYLLGWAMVLPASAQLQLGIAPGAQPVVTVSGSNGAKVEVQWSDSLVDSSRWFFLTNITLGSPFQVTDPQATQAVRRFYRAALIPNTDMVLIPGGTFSMGDTFSEGFANERPVHTATVSSFYMARTELKYLDWTNAYAWAVTHGYSFDNSGSVKTNGHPVHTVNWYDAVKWCNARSEMEGRTPAYYTGPEQTNAYRTGRLNLSSVNVRWSANGYRLPTEAEWERAARSGEVGWRFPWGNTISHSNANYFATTIYSYDLGGNNLYHPDYNDGNFPLTSPVGSFPANRYGVHDLIGNVWEWCWDRFDPAWYSNPSASHKDTHGSDGPTINRIMRGGSCIDDASYGRNANRGFTLLQAPDSADFAAGFRFVMALPGFLAASELRDPAALSGGQFRFTIYNLTPGKTNIVESSTNLATWTAIGTNVPSIALLNFTNSPAPSSSGRYYRSRQLP